MNREFSIYLDLVRFLSALIVVVHHSNDRRIITDPVLFAGYGNSAVMVFFVLSGFVIAYVTDKKERTPRQYIVSRAARIYPVAIAAVLLTLFLDLAGKSISPEFYTGSPHDLWFVRLASSLMFTNELWFVSIQSFSNVPYWSLNFEVWYYVIFGAFMFCPPHWRMPVCAALLVLLGPKIVLLFPVWLAGVYTYRIVDRHRISEALGWVLLVASLLGVWWMHAYGITRILSLWLRQIIGPHWHFELTSSQYFLSHYILAVFIGANFVGIFAISHRLRWLALRTERAIRFLAGYTFSLYLLHVPLIFFFATVIDGDPDRPWYYVMVMGNVFLWVFVVGTYTEQRKGRVKQWLLELWDRSAEAFRALARP